MKNVEDTAGWDADSTLQPCTGSAPGYETWSVQPHVRAHSRTYLLFRGLGVHRLEKNFTLLLEQGRTLFLKLAVSQQSESMLHQVVFNVTLEELPDDRRWMEPVAALSPSGSSRRARWCRGAPRMPGGSSRRPST